MLTVADALELEELETARVVAGQNGVGRVISWLHTANVPELADWLNGGEFILATIINIPAEPEAQKQYLLRLIEKEVSALAIAVGQMLKSIPYYLRAIADAHDFPLIEISYQARFVDIARTVNEQITQQNMAMVSRALSIHQTLTRVVLEGGGMKQLAETLADLIHQSISIETARFEALASVNIAPVDEARRYTQQYGRTDPRLVRALEDDVLPEIRRTLRPVFIPAMPHVGLEMERILAPVVVHGEIYGYMWIIADERPLTDLDYMAIESGATIAALIMLYQESLQNAEASLKGSLLTRLIQSEANNAVVLTDQALRYGVDLRLPFRLMLIDYTKATTKQLLELYRRINSIVVSESRSAIVGQFAGQVVVLAQCANGAAEVNTLADRIRGEGGTTRIGISAAHTGASRVALAHTQCGEVLDIAQKLDMYAQTVHFDDLGYLHALYQAGPRSLEDNAYTPALCMLLDEQQADLFNTLEAYLDLGGNGVSTAEALHIHRSTLNYRLQRIEEICSAKLSDPATRMNLQVALKLMRLFGTNSLKSRY